MMYGAPVCMMICSMTHMMIFTTNDDFHGLRLEPDECKLKIRKSIIGMIPTGHDEIPAELEVPAGQQDNLHAFVGYTPSYLMTTIFHKKIDFHLRVRRFYIDPRVW